MHLELIPRFCDVDLERPAQAYNEAAFRYFLAIERKRSERSSRPFALLLLDLKKQMGTSDRIDPEIAARLFSSMALSLRETDFIGWYREGVVAGAVLTPLFETPETDLAHQVRQRVTDVLFKSLPSDIADRFKSHIYRLPAQAQELSETRS